MRVLFIISAILFGLTEGNFNNVCSDLREYRNVISSPKCWYDPDVGATPEGIASNHGYHLERHQVMTEDGLILTVFRIPPKSSKSREKVLLCHGFGFDGTTYIINGRDSLAFFLSDQGYDVWIINFRGTKYAQHVKYNEYQSQFWDFSFHEMGIYDIPATIELLKTKTNTTDKITLVGYSMGATSSFVYLSSRSKHAKNNVKSFNALAPVVFMKNVRSPLKIISIYRNIIRDILGPIASYGIGGRNTQILSLLQEITCTTYPGLILCSLLAAILSGHNPDDIRPENIPVAFSHASGGVSFKLMLHYAQFMANPEGRFRQFDYRDINSYENQRIYNSTEPPSYNLQRIKVPVHIFYGPNDTLADEEDVIDLYNTLNGAKTITKVLPDGSSNFCHTDFAGCKSLRKLFELLIANWM